MPKPLESRSALFSNPQERDAWIRMARRTGGFRITLRPLTEEEASRFTDGRQADPSTVADWGAVILTGKKEAFDKFTRLIDEENENNKQTSPHKHKPRK